MISSKRFKFRKWLIPSILALIMFVGGVASNLIASYLEKPLQPYQYIIWILFILALIITIVTAIKENKNENLDAKGSVNIKNLKDISGKVEIHTGTEITNIYNLAKFTTLAFHQIPPAPADFVGRSEQINNLLTLAKNKKKLFVVFMAWLVLVKPV